MRSATKTFVGLAGLGIVVAAAKAGMPIPEANALVANNGSTETAAPTATPTTSPTQTATPKPTATAKPTFGYQTKTNHHGNCHTNSHPHSVDRHRFQDQCGDQL